MLRQCFSSGAAADGHTTYKARPSTKLTNNYHVRPTDFITFWPWLSRKVLSDQGFKEEVDSILWRPFLRRPLLQLGGGLVHLNIDIIHMIQWLQSSSKTTTQIPPYSVETHSRLAVSSNSSHHPQEVLLAQFSPYVHCKCGLKPHSFHLISTVSAFTASEECEKSLLAWF